MAELLAGLWESELEPLGARWVELSDRLDLPHLGPVDRADDKLI